MIFRITALDPANPPFYPGTSHISASDANLVDIIHTDAWLYGAPVSTGSIDFWPNSGKTLQPGCPKRNYKQLTDNGELEKVIRISIVLIFNDFYTDLCSHRRSWRFWADSVANPNELSFPAVKSNNWSAFKSGRAEKSLIVHMGIDCEGG